VNNYLNEDRAKTDTIAEEANKALKLRQESEN